VILDEALRNNIFLIISTLVKWVYNIG
jgi:hypothetical protein